ncbi:hypothetical protein [Microbulbifer halophilus]|uniref:hypothetical protein n=1 Tax=Microbulbifer halophilus TaxID=453963 RepID=UPI00361E89F8
MSLIARKPLILGLCLGLPFSVAALAQQSPITGTAAVHLGTAWRANRNRCYPCRSGSTCPGSVTRTRTGTQSMPPSVPCAWQSPTTRPR